MPEGKLSHVGIAPEVIWGDPVAAIKQLKIVSESLTLSIEDLVSAGLMGMRDEPVSYEGLSTVAGDTVHEVHPENLGHILRSWFGAPSSTDRTGSFRHEFLPKSGKPLEDATATDGTATTLVDTGEFTIDEHIGRWVNIYSGTGAGQWRRITDNDADSLTVSAEWTTNPNNTSKYRVLLGPKDCILPPYTIEVHRDLPGTTQAFQFKGCIANSLAFSIGVGTKILNLTSSWLCKDTAVIAATTPGYPATNPFMWHKMKIGIGQSKTGVATTSAAATLVDNAGGLVVNAYAGDLLRVLTGTGIKQTRIIVSNDATTYTVSPNWTVVPVIGDTYEVISANNNIETLNWSFDNGLVAIPTLNYSKLVSKIVGDAFRTGAISSTMIPEDITDWNTYFKGWSTRRWILYFLGDNITGNHFYELEIELPQVLFTAYPIAIGGPGRMTVGISAKIKYNSTLLGLAKVMLWNNTATY